MTRENYDAYTPLIELGGDGLDVMECIESNVAREPEIAASLLRDAFDQGFVPSRNTIRYAVRRAGLDIIALICSVETDELARILYEEDEDN